METSKELDHITDWFWDIIEQANKDQATLKKILAKMSRQELKHFQEQFVDAAAEFQAPPFTDHIIKGSEDSVMDVAHWVVSQGKDLYTDIYQHPEKIPKSVEESDPTILSGVAPG